VYSKVSVSHSVSVTTYNTTSNLPACSPTVSFMLNMKHRKFVKINFLNLLALINEEIDPRSIEYEAAF